MRRPRTTTTTQASASAVGISGCVAATRCTRLAGRSAATTTRSSRPEAGKCLSLLRTIEGRTQLRRIRSTMFQIEVLSKDESNQKSVPNYKNYRCPTLSMINQPERGLAVHVDHIDGHDGRRWRWQQHVQHAGGPTSAGGSRRWRPGSGRGVATVRVELGGRRRQRRICDGRRRLRGGCG